MAAAVAPMPLCAAPTRDEADLPVVNVGGAHRAQAYLKHADEMHRLFAQLPAALEATGGDPRRWPIPTAAGVEHAARAALRPGPAVRPRTGSGLPIGSGFDELVERALPERFAENGPRRAGGQVRERAAAEVRAICRGRTGRAAAGGLRRRPVLQSSTAFRWLRAARRPTVWSPGRLDWCLVELCPLDYGLDAQLFVHEGRGDLPDLDLEVSSCTSRR